MLLAKYLLGSDEDLKECEIIIVEVHARGRNFMVRQKIRGEESDLLFYNNSPVQKQLGYRENYLNLL